MQKNVTNKVASFFQGALIGAGITYFTDPTAGRRRRIVLRDKACSKASSLSCFLDKAFRDLTHRAYGIMAETRYKVRGKESGEEKIQGRIQSKLGHYVSHPSSVQVLVDKGDVHLMGSVLKNEVDRVVQAIRTIPGVSNVSSELVVHHDAEYDSEVQGGSPRLGHVPEYRQSNWTPSLRLFVSLLGLGLVAPGLRRKRIRDYGMLLFGGGLLTRAYLNQELSRTFGLASGRRGISVQKTLNVRAPITDVFDFFVDPTSFPKFMRHIREVRDLGDGRSHWVVGGPAGIPVTWNAITTKIDPNQAIAWRSENNSQVAHAGIIKFEELDIELTRVQITLTYNLPAGVLGNIVTKIFGGNPKREIDEDMNRVKSYLEGGRPARDAARPIGA
ncbi:MAG: SRPBCC family protein [Oligoflexales bacterium]